MSPLRSSRQRNIYLDEERAKMIEQRRLGRQKDIESVERVMLKTTGVKVGAPKLRNISQIRESVVLNPRSPQINNKTKNSMLADLQELEKLRTSPIVHRHNGNEAISRSQSRRSQFDMTKDVSKAHSDMMKIQQMFQNEDDDQKKKKQRREAKVAPKPRSNRALEMIEEKSEQSRTKKLTKHSDRTKIVEDDQKRPQPPLRKHRNNLKTSREAASLRNESQRKQERPDILEGLVKESDQQLDHLQLDRSRSRNNWRGFVQSIKFYDCELNSDGEEQHKSGEYYLHHFYCSLFINVVYFHFQITAIGMHATVDIYSSFFNYPLNFSLFYFSFDLSIIIGLIHLTRQATSRVTFRESFGLNTSML